MIRAELRLSCERCERLFQWFPVTEEPVARDVARELRASARLRGWRRYRPKGARRAGDYCPTCLAVVAIPQSGEGVFDGGPDR